MAEITAKKRLQEVSQRWNQKISIDQVLGIYKNSEKYTLERQMSLLKQMFKNYVQEFSKHEAQFEADVKKNKKTTYEAFISFLNNILVVPASQKPQIAAKPRTSSTALSSKADDFESPALSSTRVDNNNVPSEIIVSEVSKQCGSAFIEIKFSDDFSD